MNPRLIEIQKQKKEYKEKIRESENIGEMLEYKQLIDELIREENQILRRCKC